MYAEREWRRDAPATTATIVERLRDEPDGERRSEAGEAAVHDFAAVVSRACDEAEVRRALGAAVRWAAGDSASWLAWDDEAARGAESIPIRAAGGRAWGRIEVGRAGGDPSARNAAAVRRLETVATLAALAFDRLDRGARAPRPAADGAERAPEPALHDATLLSAVLPFAIGQARRHEEPLSILFVAIDQLRGVRDLLGAAEADRVVARVGARVAGLLRSSDLVGRLDDDRLMAVLPRAELRDARQVGEKLARKVAADPSLSGLPLRVSLSVGAAELPACASTLGGLLDAADAALSEARGRASKPAAARP